MNTWTDELKAKAIAMYKEAEPTPDTSMEIVKEIAEELEQSPNGVRMILTKADVYIKKAAASGTTTTAKASGSGTSTRVSKEAAHTQLTEAIEAVGGNVDSEIISKLTGKAALYLAGVINAARPE